MAVTSLKIYVNGAWEDLPGAGTSAPMTRLLTAGTGLTGGGDLSADRTFAVSYGTTAGSAAAGNDARLSNARTPTAHASTHASAGSDAITIVESQVTSLVSPLADAATIAVNAALGNKFRVTLGGNRILGNPTNAVNGQMLLFEIIQDATGGRTLTLDTKYVLGTDITSITLTTTLNKRDFLGVQYNSTTDKFYVLAFAKGY